MWLSDMCMLGYQICVCVLIRVVRCMCVCECVSGVCWVIRCVLNGVIS